MAKLIVRKLGAEFAQLELVSGQEYIVGRASGCALALEEAKGISRQHLRIHDQSGSWTVELLSRYGGLIYDGQSADAINLVDNETFSVPPYEFLYIEKERQAEPPPVQDGSAVRQQLREEKSLVAQQPTELRPIHSSHISENTSGGVPMVVNHSGEHTSAGVSQLIPYLKISFPDHGKDEVVKLEGNIWVAGRDAACEIPIDDHHVSRRHFELAHTSEGFYITDLDSANGTQINGEKIVGSQPRQIQSGDRISIMDVNIDFEVRDNQFEQRLQQAQRNLPVLAPINQMIMPQNPYHNMMTPYRPEGAPAVMKVTSGKDGFSIHDLKDIEFYKKNKARVGIVLMIPVIAYFAMSDTKPKTAQKKDSASTSVTYDTLSPEQKTAIKDYFQLATNLYVKGKYQLCISELQKMHQIIPQYENSKELLDFCQHGADLTVKIENDRRIQKEKEEAERRIKIVTDDCKQRINPNMTSQEMEVCLGPAIEISPEHPFISEALSIVVGMEKERQDRQNQLNAQQARVSSGKAQYYEAKRLAKTGRLAAAIQAYQRFLNGGYSQLSQEESNARREVASVKKQLDVKVKDLLGRCKSLRSEGKFKDAYLTCQDAREEDPGNQEALSQMKLAESEMKTELKRLYEDSALEESLGNLEAAMGKWKKIMDEDLKNGEYYTKARKQLKKYGVGM